MSPSSISPLQLAELLSENPRHRESDFLNSVGFGIVGSQTGSDAHQRTRNIH